MSAELAMPMHHPQISRMAQIEDFRFDFRGPSSSSFEFRHRARDAEPRLRTAQHPFDQWCESALISGFIVTTSWESR